MLGIPLQGGAVRKGPCPRCGGRDRFTAKGAPHNLWSCNQCHPEWGDAVELVRWRTGATFPDAVALLLGGHTDTPARQSAPAPATSDQAGARAFNVAFWEDVLAAAAQRLHGPLGGAGRAYLAGRGLEDHSLWEAYGLGLVEAHVPGGAGRAPAISIPWRDPDGALAGVRFRFLEPQGSHRFTSVRGSRLGGGFGLRQLPAPDPDRAARGLSTLRSRRALIVVEGEFNLLSIAAHSTTFGGFLQADAVSLGSESAHLGPALLAAARDYGAVFVWGDRGEAALRWRQEATQAGLPVAALRSPGDADANDLHRADLLAAFLTNARCAAATSATQRAGALFDLWDAGQERPLNGVEHELLESLGAGVAA